MFFMNSERSVIISQYPERSVMISQLSGSTLNFTKLLAPSRHARSRCDTYGTSTFGPKTNISKKTPLHAFRVELSSCALLALDFEEYFGEVPCALLPVYETSPKYF